MALVDQKTFDVAIVGEEVPPIPPPGMATLVVDTTPVKGEVYLDGVSQGIAPVTLVLDPRIYTVSFGDIEGYITPKDVSVPLVEGQSLIVTSEYKTEGPPEVLGVPWWLVGAGVAGVGIVYLATRKP